ncbi:MAG TPA: carboxylating nicotinate-nucleotide diphosphorylase [Thermomicrobiales bacterium]|nr:carboxylating nicotinate-nucleotide diphosphorylase [Thermomicrobiales bacterium]
MTYDPSLELIDLALREDLSLGDLTSEATVPIDRQATATMLAKQDGVISGMAAARAVFTRIDPSVRFEALVADGDQVSRGTKLAVISGNARSILAAERTALNFIQRLSGIATVTAAYVAQVAGTGAAVIDTRKTTPGLRALEKAAVRHGGGANHRFNLGDAVLIKDNHLAAIGGPHPIRDAILAAKKRAPHTSKVEVEVVDLAGVREALDAGADIIMLDNMSHDEMREAVKLVGHRALVEASGGITLETLADVAATGVDLISAGALTHSAPSLDISLDFEIATS